MVLMHNPPCPMKNRQGKAKGFSPVRGTFWCEPPGVKMGTGGSHQRLKNQRLVQLEPHCNAHVFNLAGIVVAQ